LANRIVIEPGTRNKNYWKDLWNYRGLFYFLAWRDVLVRYKQAVIGIGWSILKPLLTICAMWAFGLLMKSKVPSDVPRALLSCTATLPWTLFSSAFSESSNSLINNTSLLSKVYFPRLIIPASTIIVCLIDFFISLVILALFLIGYRYVPDWKICLMPLFLLLTLITSMGAGIFVSALNVKYRDFRYVVGFIVQFGLFVSPIAFSSSQVYNSDWPRIIKLLYSLNPMVGVIDGFSWSVLGNKVDIYLPGFLLSIVISFLFLVIGIWYFRKTEKSFADVI